MSRATLCNAISKLFRTYTNKRWKFLPLVKSAELMELMEYDAIICMLQMKRNALYHECHDDDDETKDDKTLRLMKNTRHCVSFWMEIFSYKNETSFEYYFQKLFIAKVDWNNTAMMQNANSCRIHSLVNKKREQKTTKKSILNNFNDIYFELRP